MDIGYVTSVTITEFLVWYSAGELRLLRRRMLPVGLQDGLPEADFLVRQQVMDLLPHVDLEDEHSILLVSLSRDVFETDSPQPFLTDVAYVSSSAILTVQPLTQRGGDILRSRLQGMDVQLESPLFGDEAEELWANWSGRRSEKGASALLDLVVQEPAFKPSFAYQQLALEGVALLNEQKEKPPEGSPFLLHVLCYNRHKAIGESDVGFLMDLGVVLAQYAEKVADVLPIVNELRALCKKLHNDDRPLADLLVISDVRKVDQSFAIAHSDDMGLYKAVLFLKWKYRVQRSQVLELDALLAEVKECSGRVEKRSIEEAVWLFGLYLGFDRMARECYLRSPDRYRFLKTSIPHTPVELAVEINLPPLLDEKQEPPKEPAPKEEEPKAAVPEDSGKDEEKTTSSAESPPAEIESGAETKEPSPAPAPKSSYAKMKVPELRKILKERGVKGISKLNKEQLVAAVENSEIAEQNQLGLEPSDEDSDQKGT